jgi:hypothetical protein
MKRLATRRSGREINADIRRDQPNDMVGCCINFEIMIGHKAPPRDTPEENIPIARALFL